MIEKIKELIQVNDSIELYDTNYNLIDSITYDKIYVDIVDIYNFIKDYVMELIDDSITYTINKANNIIEIRYINK